MRRLLTFAAIVIVAACHDSPLAPVQTVDGQWSGVQNGFSLSLSMTQADTLVSGSALIASVTISGVQGSAVGSFVYPKLHLTLSFPGFEDASYDGTMSQAEAKIFGHLNGSGISNTEVDLRKR